MSQVEIMIIIDELGGRAKGPVIVEKAKEKFPHLQLYTYVYDRLSTMRKHGDVGWDPKTHEWYIINRYMMDNRNIVELK